MLWGKCPMLQTRLKRQILIGMVQSGAQAGLLPQQTQLLGVHNLPTLPGLEFSDMRFINNQGTKVDHSLPICVSTMVY